jgi:hypothetical protein
VETKLAHTQTVNYNYSFGEETLTIGGQNYESLIVRIGNQKWLYSFSDGQMRLSELDSNGGSLTFVKKYRIRRISSIEKLSNH